MLAGVLKKGASPDDVPQRVSDVDVTSLQLSAEEGFVFSRIDGKTSVRDLPALTGFSDSEVARALQRLRALGMVRLPLDQEPNAAGTRKPKTASAGGNSDPYAGIIFDIVSLNEDCDLSTEQKKKILFYATKLDKWNHFELLGLGRGSSAADVRNAYFKASKVFHPDAYFRKQLGSFAARIDRIFKAMKVAYDLLSNDETRAAYEETIVWPLTAEDEKQLVDRAKRKKREVKRQELRRSRRLKRNPMIARIKKAAELYRAGIEALQNEKWIEAANHLRLAITFDPQRKIYHQPFSEASTQARYLRAINLVKTLEFMIGESDSDQERLPDLIEELQRLAEDRPDILAQGAETLLQGGRVRVAFEMAQRAVAAGESNERALLVLAQAAERAEKYNVAYRSVEKLCLLKPKDASFKTRLKKLKKKI